MPYPLFRPTRDSMLSSQLSSRGCGMCSLPCTVNLYLHRNLGSTNFWKTDFRIPDFTDFMQRQIEEDRGSSVRSLKKVYKLSIESEICCYMLKSFHSMVLPLLLRLWLPLFSGIRSAAATTKTSSFAVSAAHQSLQASLLCWCCNSVTLLFHHTHRCNLESYFLRF